MSHHQEREWRYLKRDARSHHLAETLRKFVDGILAGFWGAWEESDPRHRGQGARVVHRRTRKAPTGRAPGRPKGAKDSRPRKSFRQ